MAMTDVYIKKFGSKLLVDSKSINKIPDEYLKQAFNCRCNGAGIYPRKGKELLLNSVLGTKNRGGFLLDDVLYQITNSRIYSVDTLTGVQTEIATLGYDARTDVLVYSTDFAIIVSEGQPLSVFDGAAVTTPASVPVGDTGGIIEFINSSEGYVLYGINNILYISRPILPGNPEYAYDFTNAEAQNITYKSDIVGIKTTLSGVYIFTADGRVEFIGTQSLQDVAGVATFVSTLLGIGGEPVNNRAIAASGDQIFYITKNRKVNTVNYIPGTDRTTIGKLSSQAVIGIDELMKGIDDEQPDGEAFYNENDDTIQFHVRQNNSQFNNIVLVYDLLNTSFSVDTGKKYNYMVSIGPDYYGFSDLNSSIYRDDVGFSDAGIAIPFRIRTQSLNYQNIRQKLFGGNIIGGGIGSQTVLTMKVIIDGQNVFSEDISGADFLPSGLGEIGGQAIGEAPIGGDISYVSEIQPFDRLGDEGRIYEHGTRVEIEITGTSQVQDFIIDLLGMRVEQTNNIDLKNKF